MATFSYSALDGGNSYQRGTIQSRTSRSATIALERKGLSVISLQVEKRRTWLNTELSRGLGLPDRILFSRQLHAMLEAGMGLDEALKTITEQTTSDRFRLVLNDMHRRVQKGQPFHAALAQYPTYFAPLYVNLVKVGESSGKLGEVLAYLLEQQEKEYALRSKVVNALLYPTIILIALFAMVSLMLVFVIPRIAEVLESYDVALPLQTRILVNLSHFVSAWWYVIVPILLLCILLLRRFKETKRGKRWWDNFLLTVPGVKTLVREVNLARLMRTMTATLKSGLSIDRSLELSATVVRHTAYQESAGRALGLVRRGASLGEVWRGQTKLFPPITTRMIEVGEKTGKLEHMLDRLALYYETSVDTKLSNLSSIIEPLLILVIGLIVGYVAVSVMTPIWSFSQTI